MPVAAPDSKPRQKRSAVAALSDADLIKACLDGRQAAWDEVVDRYGRLVYSIPRRYGFSDADADDIFQTVYFSRGGGTLLV